MTATAASSVAPRIRGLIMDFGGVIIKTPFELLRGLEQRLGLASQTFDWHGPFAPERDPLWGQMQAGEITEREYWRLRAAQAGEIVGQTWTMRELVANLEADEREFIRPEAVAFLESAKAAGVPVVVLTNDLEAFHGDQWFGGLTIRHYFDHVVDGSITGILKPDARSYALALASIGLPASETLFVDDQPGNAAGAQAAGLNAILFDVTQPAATYDAIRSAVPELGR